MTPEQKAREIAKKSLSHFVKKGVLDKKDSPFQMMTKEITTALKEASSKNWPSDEEINEIANAFAETQNRGAKFESIQQALWKGFSSGVNWLKEYGGKGECK